MANSKSHNIRAPLKIRARCLHQTGGFRGRPIEWCHLNLPLTDPCCHGNQPPLFEHNIGNNSASMEDTTPIPAPSRGLSGSTNLTVGLRIGKKRRIRYSIQPKTLTYQFQIMLCNEPFFVFLLKRHKKSH